MAGNYPDAPSWRMAFDRDGTQVYRIVNSTPAALTAANIAEMNDEDTGAYGFGTAGQLTFIFPELRDLDGYYFYVWNGGGSGSASISSIQVSADTTNGVDGTWATITLGAAGTTSKPGFRQQIVSSTALAIRAVRFNASTSGQGSLQVGNLHLYGEPAPGENADRLELWHPTMDEKLPPAFLDWGDVPRTSSADRTFRVKNLSGSLTARSVRVAMEVLTDATPSVPAQHTLSYGGGSFLAQVNLGDLAPGAISGPVTLRRVTPSDAVLGLWTFRVFAESTNWG